MTITIAVAGRIATATATTQVVAGNTYPVTLSLDSEWTGSLYLRVRFGGLYYDIPFASSATSVDVQMPVGYPEVGIGVFSEALEICTNEARVRLLRSILEAGEQVVEFDGDLYDQWAGEVTTLLTDSAFDAESTNPVQNAVITAWKGQVEGGAMTIGGAKAFTSPVTVPAPTASGHAVNVSALEARLADGSVTKVGTADVGSDARPVKFVGGVPTAVGADLALDSAVVHTSGAETIAGNKTFTGIMTVNGDITNVVSSPRVYTANFQRWGVKCEDLKDGAPNTIATDKVLGVYSSGYNARQISVANPDRTAFQTVELRAFTDHQLVIATPYYPVDGQGNPQAIPTNALMTSGNIAVDPRIVHSTGNETIAGNKTFSGTVNAPKIRSASVSINMTPNIWYKAYEITPASVGQSVILDIFNTSSVSSLVGAELRIQVPNANWPYSPAANLFNVGSVLVGKLAKTAAGKLEVWLCKTSGSAQYIMLNAKYLDLVVPTPAGTSGTEPVQGDDYPLVVTIGVVS